MGIVKRANGTYQAQVYFKRKMVLSKRGFRTEREAKKWYMKKLSSYDPKARDQKNRTFDELLEKYINEVLLVESRPNTRARYLLDIKHSIKPFFCYRNLSTITPSLVSEFRSNLLTEGRLKPKSINMVLSVLSAIFRRGVDWEWLDRSPLRLKPLKLPPAKYHWWDNREHIQAFLNAASNSICYLAYRIALECGLRRGEILGLSPCDINTERRSIHIWRQWDVRQLKYGPPKHNRERYVSWSSDSNLGDLLKDRISETTDENILFSFEGPGHRLSATTLANDTWYKIIKESGVPEIRFHDLRHTFASWYMLSGGNEWDLVGLMGHKNPEMTRKYAHLKAGSQRIVEFGWQEISKPLASHFPILKVVNESID